MKTRLFDYHLPPEMIAQRPLPRREDSRMMVLRRSGRTSEDSRFERIADYLRPGDLLVINNSRVIKARLRGIRAATGGKIEVFLVRRWDGEAGESSSTGAHGVSPAGAQASRGGGTVWLALTKSGGRLRVGEKLVLGGGMLSATLLRRLGEEGDIVEFDADSSKFDAIVKQIGEAPIPPYIRRGPDKEDEERYQTVYAREAGSVAAPTAGLHFSDEMLRKLREAGIGTAEVTLHVGPGTFKPVKSEEVKDHEVGSEFYAAGEETVKAIRRTRQAGGRIVAVGTTSLRVIETLARRGAFDETSARTRWEGMTDLFVYPPFEFAITDALLTNFHLPKSSLLMLVCAFASPGRTDGIEWVLDRYEHAKKEGYRFYSYGDCMLIL